MKESLRGILNEVIDTLDEVYDWEDSELRQQTVTVLEDIQDALEELIRKL